MQAIKRNESASRIADCGFAKVRLLAFTFLSAFAFAVGFAPHAGAQTTLTDATYDAATGTFAVTGANMASGHTIVVSKLTVTGEGGVTHTLTSANVTASSATAFSITLNGSDKTAFGQIINKNGISSTGGTTYNLAAADDWDADVTVGNTSVATVAITASNVLVSQTITFGTNPGPRAYFGTLALFVTATGGASGNPVTFTSLTPNICTPFIIVASFLSHAGTCTIAANQAGNFSYAAAPQVTQDIIITKYDLIITFGTNPGPVIYSPGGSFFVSATLNYPGSETGLITFSSLTTAICTVTGTTVTSVAAGSCNIAANIMGNADFNPAPQVTQTISIDRIPQRITFGANPGPVPYGGALQFLSLNATGGTSGNVVTFSSLTPAVCGIYVFRDTLGIVVSAGTCIIAANQAGNATHEAATQVTQDIIITKRNQTIVFEPNPGSVTYSVGGSFTVIAATNAPGLTGPVTLTSLTLGVCTVSNTTVTIVMRGDCVIAANNAGDANINPAPQATQTITINGIPQAISFTVPPYAYVGDTFTLSASGGISGNPVIFTSTTPTVCTNIGNTFTALAVGSCIVSANQAGSAYYAPAPQVTQGINVRAIPTLLSVVSRKQHLGIDRDIVIDALPPIGGNLSTEPRAIGAGHRIVFQFDGPIISPGFAGAVDSGLFDIGTASAVINSLASNEVVVTLTGIPENKRVLVSLLAVNGNINVSAAVGFLLGDVNGSRSVNSSDISGIKARSGQTADASNFRFDVNVSGTINSSDISAVKARSGLMLPP